MDRAEFERIVEERVRGKILKLPVEEEKVELDKRYYRIEEVYQIREPEEFVRILYRQLLKREVDPEGLAHYAGLLERGELGYWELVELIATSEEARQRGVEVEGVDRKWGERGLQRLGHWRRRLRSWVKRVIGVATLERSLIGVQKRCDQWENLIRLLNLILEKLQTREIERWEGLGREVYRIRQQVDHLSKFAPPRELPPFHLEEVPYSPPPPEGEYQALQDFFVPSEVVLEKLKIYRQFLPRRGEGIWVDAGTGRGEFLELLRQEGIEGVGVDIQLSSIETLHRKGLRGVLGDINSYLKSSPDPIGGISAIQVIEHLEWDYLEEFIQLAYRRLSPGGIIILETPNPAAPRVFNNFYIDYTHRRPIPRELLAFLLLRAGFRELKWVYSSPFHTSPRLEENYLDYGIVGWKPKDPTGKGE